ncbi:MAG: PHP domain-containing protein [Clostridia bacterium]|nr:PHP domain-containing protein [Clostridia bacterium]
MLVDLHLHTTASDGTDTPEELIERACEWGEAVISITDHDTTQGLEAARACVRGGIRLINGVEFSCAYPGPKRFRCHILGYGVDFTHPSLVYAIESGRARRLEKKEKRLEYLAENFGIVFTAAELAKLDEYDSVGKLHLANLIVERGLAENNTEAIDKYLSGYSLPDDRIDISLAISAILESGGIPVWAHPLGGEREKRIDYSEVGRRIEIMKAVGLRGVECFYSRYTGQEALDLAALAERHSLLVSAGSDYHGKNKTVELGSLGADGYTPSMDEVTILKALM